MTYSISILRRAQKELAALPKNEYTRIRDAISKLGEDPRPSGCRKPTGRLAWRIRIGSYRVLYEVDDTDRRITVMHVGHRRDVYR